MSVMLIDSSRAGSLINGIRQFSQMWNCSSFLSSTDTGTLYTESLQKFLRNAYRANLETWNRKYNESDTMPDILPATGEPMNKYQTLKALQALHYNIEEEYVPEAKKLIDQLKIMIDEIKDNIIDAIPEYETAAWG